jgi:dihydrolipoamide dehydrogenase
MEKNTFDLVVVGGGPGGYVAAIRGAQLGMKVALIEREHLGGICLNWGCIPTKALLRSAEIAHLLNHVEEFGFKKQPVFFDLGKIVARSREVSSKLAAGVKHLLKKNKVTVLEGYGRFSGRKDSKIQVSLQKKSEKEKEEILTSHLIFATGARPRIIPGLEPDGNRIWTYREAMVPKEMPASVLVVGSGAIGIEFASFYNALGAQVTVVEMQDRILPIEDREISALAQKAFEKRGIQFYTKSTLGQVKSIKEGSHVSIKTEKGEVSLKVDKIISAVGIVGNTEDLGLEKTKVQIDRGHIKVNDHYATGEPGIYAIGDVVSGPWLAHKASHEGVLCVEHLAGLKAHPPMKKTNIPGCTYSHPQIASVGLTEEKALGAGLKIKVGRFPYMGNGKAIALGEPEGLIKTIFHATTGELLGAHMIGAEVTELIQGYVIAKTLETTEADLMHTVFPHPTLSEMMHESVLDAYDRAIHF